MNLHLKRHKLLGILSKQRTDLILRKADPLILGVSAESILKDLNCNEDELELIASELHTQDEIKHFNAHGVKGLFARPNGVSAFSDKKYLRLNNSRLKNNLKDLVQIIIPVLSLLITLAVILKDNSKNTKEIKAIELKLESIQDSINMLELRTKNYPKSQTNTDSVTDEKN